MNVYYNPKTDSLYIGLIVDFATLRLFLLDENDKLKEVTTKWPLDGYEHIGAL